uniref:PH domain-containing protein n=1 Tax=Glossina brevipalpis TaxID=37001 RepID=A0A1A9WMV8_9MUSC
MDPFTQQMLEKAEKRSQALGVSSVNLSTSVAEASSIMSSDGCAPQKQQQQPLLQQKQKKQLHTTMHSSGGANVNKLQVIEKQSNESNVAGIGGSGGNDNPPKKIMRQFAAIDKENMDLGIEINIMTDKHVEVQVQVEEQDAPVTDEEQMVESQQRTKQIDDAQQQQRQRVNQTTSAIKHRNTPRNCLQRLGVLYSNTGDLSSPIHRTEGQFHADTEETKENANTKPKQRLNKLAALADSINQWEDDTTHHNIKATYQSSQPPPKPDLPSRGRIRSIVQEEKADLKTKQLKWDPNVINSLEAQGFQRRKSSNLKVAYEFAKEQQNEKDDIQEKTLYVDKEKDIKIVYDKVKFVKQGNEEKKLNQVGDNKKMATVKPGLVSDRAALFENQTQSQMQNAQKPQKDPTELSLKERMKLFEKNKGEALIPKAPFGMAPPINKILQDSQNRKDEQTKGGCTKTNLPLIKSNTDKQVRAKVAALLQASNDNKIKDDIRKQREEDMLVLSNRFNKQKEFHGNQVATGQWQEQREDIRQGSHVKATAAALVTSKKATVKPQVLPPIPPPLPTLQNTATPYIKRRSSGDAIDDDTKRARKSDRQLLYTGPSNFDSNESFTDNENNYCTTATASALNTADEMKETRQPINRRDQQRNYLQQEEFEDREEEESEDSFMESKNCEDDVSTTEVNDRDEIVNVRHSNPNDISSKVQRTKIKEVRYADKDYYIQNRYPPDSCSEFSIDDYLDEALDDQADGDDDNTQDDEDDLEEKNDSHLSKGSLGTTASHSFSFRKTSMTNYQTMDEKNNNNNNNENLQTPTTSGNSAVNANNLSSGGSYMQPVKSELSVNKEGDNMVTLVHTVSFYRREKNSACSTPIRKVCREQQVLQFDNGAEDSEYTDDDLTQLDEEMDDDSHLIQQKIQKLLDEVCKQQQVIAQASQALNLCAATVEFSGSTESVEGERHLLVATHRRQAGLDEVQRLRVEKALRPPGAPRDKGRLTVKEITLPLRQSYIKQLSSDAISGHHLVCLIKYNEHVLATKSVPTLPGLLAVKFPDVLRLNDIYADFKVTIEIYGMTAQREILPHEVKYHINLNKKGGIKTPKKKGKDNCLIMPPVQSSTGLQAVRTPALVQYGFAIFSLREVQRTNWTLTQVLGVCPLEGVLHMKVNCELSISVEYKGFLAMYEDVSGFGAWHRRYCCLNGTVLNYWKYPDDVKEKAPMGSIDLYSAITQKVTVAPRDICARLNTILLECQRPALENDQESLTIIPKGRNTIIRYLMSADTKDERDQWCAYFNKALALLRAWGPVEQ